MNYTIENFISFCDRMEITEEGLFFHKKDRKQNSVPTERKVSDIFKVGDPTEDTLSEESKKIIKEKIDPELMKVLSQIKSLVSQYSSKHGKYAQFKYHVPNNSIQYYKSKNKITFIVYPIGYEAKQGNYDDVTYLQEVNNVFTDFKNDIDKIISNSKSVKFHTEEYKDNTDTPYFVHTRWYIELSGEYNL